MKNLWKSIHKILRKVGLNSWIYTYCVGAIVAIVISVSVIGLNVILDNVEVIGTRTELNWFLLISMFVAYLFEAIVEEVMFRGVVFTVLRKKASIPVAVITTSIVSTMIHISSVLNEDLLLSVLRIVNVFTLSIVLAALRVREKSLWGAIGMNSVWKFIVYGVFGMNLTQMVSNENAWIQLNVVKTNVLSGGVFGIEASLVTTALFIGSTIILFGSWLFDMRREHDYKDVWYR